jgi:hypothetical protein
MIGTITNASFARLVSMVGSEDQMLCKIHFLCLRLFETVSGLRPREKIVKHHVILCSRLSSFGFLFRNALHSADCAPLYISLIPFALLFFNNFETLLKRPPTLSVCSFRFSSYQSLQKLFRFLFFPGYCYTSIVVCAATSARASTTSSTLASLIVLAAARLGSSASLNLVIATSVRG